VTLYEFHSSGHAATEESLFANGYACRTEPNNHLPSMYRGVVPGVPVAIFRRIATWGMVVYVDEPLRLKKFYIVSTLPSSVPN